MTSPLPVLPQIIIEAGLLPDSPSQGGTTIFLDSGPGLDTGTLGSAIGWTDISVYVMAFTITRPSTRLQGPLWNYQAGTASITLDNSDGRFDPDNLAGPYVVGGVTQLTAMVPVRIRAVFSSVAYPLYSGFADGWMPAQVTYEGGYAELTLPATDAFKVLAGITLAAVSVEGVGAATGTRVKDILSRAGWYSSGDRSVVSAGNSTLQGTTLGDTALNLMQIAVDSEIGQLYVNGSGAVVFRARRDLLTDTRSDTRQAAFGDLPGVTHPAGTTATSQASNFEGGTDGTTLTVANSGGTSGAPFSAVGTSGGGTVTFSATHPAHGTLGAACATTASSSFAYVAYPLQAVPQAWCRGYFWLSGLPAATNNIMQWNDIAGNPLSKLHVTTAGVLQLTDSTSSSVITFSTAIPSGQQFRVEAWLTFPGTSSAAQAEVRLYLSADSGTATETKTVTGVTFGAAGCSEWRCGWAASSASNATVYIDDVDVNTTGWDGPATGTALAELACAAIGRASDDTTIGNDIQATRVGGTLQEVQDAASIAKYLFPRSYSRTDLILQADSDALNWAQWVLYIAKGGEDRFDTLAVDPLADPYNLWPQVLGREIGDRIQIWTRPAGVASPVSKDCFIAGITHAWDSVASSWLTTWVLQNASKYGSFLTLDNPTLGQLDSNALAF